MLLLTSFVVAALIVAGADTLRRRRGEKLEKGMSKSAVLATQQRARIEADFPKRRTINVHTIAKKTGLEVFYELAYRYPSGDAAHATFMAFHRHLKATKHGRNTLHFGPDNRELPHALHALNLAVFILVRLTVEYLGRKDAKEELLAMEARFKALYPKGKQIDRTAH